MNSASDERAALVAAARESIAKGSKSFALASNLFDRATRERAWLLYAWCRACDDIVDGQDHGHGMTAVDDAEARVALIAEKTTAALAGRVVGDMPFDALRVVAAETGLPARFAHDLVAGFRLDESGAKRNPSFFFSKGTLKWRTHLNLWSASWAGAAWSARS